MRRPVATAATVALLATFGLTSGCDDHVSDSATTDLARRLAAGLSDGDLNQVAFLGTDSRTVTDRYLTAVGGMGDIRPRVTAARATTGSDDGHATVVLQWSWPLGDRTWSYRTHASLDRTTQGWKVEWFPNLVNSHLTGGDRLAVTPISAARGHVLGAHDAAIVVPRPVSTFGIDKTRVHGRAATATAARSLARLADVDTSDYTARVLAAGPSEFVPAITWRRAEVPAAAAQGVGSIPGALRIDGREPLAPTKEFAAPILGTVGDVTAELLRQHPGRYRVGDQVGLSGLQARYDEELRGRDGAVVNRVAADGTRTPLFRAPAHAGTPLRLTLDVRLQQLAEQTLSTVGPASALIAIRPSTGAILAAANGPGNQGYNYATYGQLAPGSTFKTVSALAAIRHGLTLHDTLPCPSALTVDGKRFTNYSDYPPSELGPVTLQTAFAYSCNTAFVSTADEVTGDDLSAAASDLGVGVDHDLGFPAFFGTLPPPATSTEHAADLIGQGRVLMSPLAMAVVAASVQAGHTVVPKLLHNQDSNGPSAQPSGLTATEVASLRTMMRAVVTHGTGAALADLPGPPVLAKTGTAEFDRHGRRLTHAWMIAAQGDLAVAVFVDVGASGSHTAGPIVETFLAQAIHRH